MTALVLTACWLAVVLLVAGLCVAARSGERLRTGFDPEVAPAAAGRSAAEQKRDVSAVAR